MGLNCYVSKTTNAKKSGMQTVLSRLENLTIEGVIIGGPIFQQEIITEDTKTEGKFQRYDCREETLKQPNSK